MLPAWMSGSKGCGKLKKFLDERPELFAVTQHRQFFVVSLMHPKANHVLSPSYSDIQNLPCAADYSDPVPDVKFASGQPQSPEQPNTRWFALLSSSSAKANRTCYLPELKALPQWVEWTGRPKLKSFIKDLVTLETKRWETIVVHLRPFYLAEDASKDVEALGSISSPSSESVQEPRAGIPASPATEPWTGIHEPLVCSAGTLLLAAVIQRIVPRSRRDAARFGPWSDRPRASLLHPTYP
ncbi:unnamed protein product [Symbiodinium natans]|uniref:Uncharacterized protein n=1 Tax=Symbiodinium natans TaxID=878477 RepID=A0A812SE14_9DINO|nr:unnamed protein product [Symbiodinium natans]